MKTPIAVIAFTSVLLFSACVPTLHPLYTDEDLTMDSTLIGTWIDKESNDSWTFSSSGKLKYTLVEVEADGKKSVYDARLVNVGDKLFLDIVPAKSNPAKKEHTFVHVVSKTTSSVQISYMEPRWLKDFLKDNPTAIRHEKVNGEILLTSSPKEMQKFILQHLGTREAFSSPAALVRK